ncbi:MAG: cobalt-precorrin 5A hydrolase [Candidatus Verstraetearchaeota archaeon]|nr:cobalt-precorrin 5A hydrolase [Candidatus Verstraetearchaeota archaeon]
MYHRGVAIIAVTRRGSETAAKISAFLSKMEIKNEVYSSPPHCTGNLSSSGIRDLVGKVFGKVDAIVGVMAAGILVRAIAPFLRSKLTDPAVVCVDSSGKYAISLLSGHYGGANELARIIARGIGAVPVITTASDVVGKVSVDEVARMLHCRVINPETLAAVNSALVDGKRVGMIVMGEFRISPDLCSCYTIAQAKAWTDALMILDSFDAAAIISKETPEVEFQKPVTILKPKRIAVGVGARKASSAEEIASAVRSALSQAGLPPERVDCLATAEIKRGSPGMEGAAALLGLPVLYVGVEALRSVDSDDLSPDSELVIKKIGVGGVCERAALVAAGKGARLMLKKAKMSGVTVAVAEGE